MSEQSYIVNMEGAIVRDGRYLLIARGRGETHAAGLLSFVGGKVEADDPAENVLESTLRREIAEEVGLTVGELAYAFSSHFLAEGQPVIDIVFLCRWESGEVTIQDRDEVGDAFWMTAAEVLAHPDAPPWLPRQINRVEAVRQRLGW